MGQYGDFDVLAFHAALDAERQARGLSWAALTRELNRPLAHLPHIHPYSPSTFSGMPRRKNGTNAYTIMNVLRWLGRTPESFVPGHPDAAEAAQIPAHVPRGLGRWDFAALHAAIDSRRVGQGLTVDEAADDIGVAPAALHRLAAGKAVGMPAMMRVAIWLGRPAMDFFVWTLPPR